LVCAAKYFAIEQKKLDSKHGSSNSNCSDTANKTLAKATKTKRQLDADIPKRTK
jgi:hypothetical protein